MQKLLFLISFVFLSSLSQAALMAKGKIAYIDNTTAVKGTFAIKVEGTTGEPCNNNPHALSVSNFPDEKSFDRAFAMALTAFAAGNTVEVHSNSVSASCPYMVGIRIIK